MERFNQLLQEKADNYILPFLWLHGEPIEAVLNEIDKIEACGIKEICLESRPYPGFATQRWWEDVGQILAYAQKKNIGVWILDDDKFPTGHATGAFANCPSLAKTYIAARHMDIMGPCVESAVLIEPFLGTDGQLVSVLACPKNDTESLAVCPEGVIDLTQNVHDGFVYFTLPQGAYRLLVFFTTQKNGGRPDYVNLLDYNSVKVLVDAVYEPHFSHFGNYFGNTLRGFFSDEPEIGNVCGYDFHEVLGKANVKLPWCNELRGDLQSKWGEKWTKKLPALWYEFGEETPFIRYTFMDSVTKLIQTNFSKQLSDWCDNHNVEYVNHIIEDDNAHARLGCSIGHYFRAQNYQHRSGIDVVHHQIVPGFTEKIHQWIAGDADGEFFHFGLAKMGSSLSHLRPQMKGRALCEIFGNYGWAEDISLMMWLTNHMLVRGINCFIPHAFSPLFPDRDCPPHFYAQGNNPQYEAFSHLMRYMNRVSHLLNGGVHKAQALVLYHADSEWGSFEAMPFQKPVRQLLENQLDCDVISADLLSEAVFEKSAEGNTVNYGKEKYGCLIIPYCHHVPNDVVEFCAKAKRNGVPVFMVNALPKATTLGDKLPPEFETAVEIVNLNNIAKRVGNITEPTFYLQQNCEFLRSLEYEHKDCTVIMLFNESVDTTLKTTMNLKASLYNTAYEYCAITNTYKAFSIVNKRINVNLFPGQASIYILCNENVLQQQEKCVMQQQISSSWRVEKAPCNEPSSFEYMCTVEGNSLPNMNGPEFDNKFTGYFKYTASFCPQRVLAKKCYLRLPKIGGAAKVYIDGKEVGMFLSCNDSRDVTEYLKFGKEQKICVEIANTLVWKIRDGASTHLQVYATGMLSEPILEWMEC